MYFFWLKWGIQNARIKSFEREVRHQVDVVFSKEKKKEEQTMESFWNTVGCKCVGRHIKGSQKLTNLRLLQTFMSHKIHPQNSSSSNQSSTGIEKCAALLRKGRKKNFKNFKTLETYKKKVQWRDALWHNFTSFCAFFYNWTSKVIHLFMALHFGAQ